MNICKRCLEDHVLTYGKCNPIDIKNRINLFLVTPSICRLCRHKTTQSVKEMKTIVKFITKHFCDHFNGHMTVTATYKKSKEEKVK